MGCKLVNNNIRGKISRLPNRKLLRTQLVACYTSKYIQLFAFSKIIILLLEIKKIKDKYTLA